MMRPARKISIVLIVIVSLLNNAVARAQDNIVARDTTLASDLTYVRWVSEYPSPDSKGHKKGIFGRIGEFIFGPGALVLTKPMAIFAQSPENYYVLDQKTVSLTHIHEQKGSTLKPKSKLVNPPGSLVGLCDFPGRGFLITDSRINTLFVMSTDGKRVAVLNDTLVLDQPTGIAYLAAKNEIWVLETKAHQIAILNANGERIKTIGLRGNKPGEFNYPTHIWIDQQGLVYIVDSMNYRIQIFNADGGWVSMFGQAGDASGYFARPKGIATDSHGNIYVVDALFHNVQIFNSKGQLLYHFGNQGRESGNFWMPNGIYIDKNDYIYIADSYNSRVQIFQLINHE